MQIKALPEPHYSPRCEENRKVYFSLRTSDLQRAARRLVEIRANDWPQAPPKKEVSAAVVAFLKSKDGKSPETQRKYKNSLGTLVKYCDEHSIRYLSDATLETLDGYVAQYRRASIGWHKHVEILRQFWRFATARKWCDENPALLIELPDLLESEEVVPYTRDEVRRIIAACDRVGKLSYERLRARAIVLLLRFTGMRISDVVTLSREHIQGDYIVKRAIKNKKWLRIELPMLVRQALEVLPHPQAAARDSKMYFAGQGTMPSLRKGAERLLWSVFKLANVEGAYPHRFRHTFASELLAKGTPIEVVADLLGDLVAIVRKHYQKWMPQWQAKKDQASRKLTVEPSTNLLQGRNITN